MESDLRVVLTRDGSPTLYRSLWNEHYHSIHGALAESMHVFIEMGLRYRLQSPCPRLSILEMGLGTGLNALLSAMYAPLQEIDYVGIEKFPLPEQIWTQLDYCSAISIAGCEETYKLLHEAPWNLPQRLSQTMTLFKHHGALEDYQPAEKFDLIYYDAFAPGSQPELWDKNIFDRIYGWCRPGAVFVTYSAKGEVRRAMREAGFDVEKLPGPPGKREMLRGRVLTL